MNSRRLAKIIGWAFAHFVGGGLFFLICAALLIAWSGRTEPPEFVRNLMVGTPLLFSCVAVYHELTGKLTRTNHALRTIALFVLWPLSFYFVTLGLVVLMLTIPSLGSAFGILIFAPALAGGTAGSLCWRGKLPGTRAIPTSRPSQAPDQPGGQKDKGDEENQAI